MFKILIKSVVVAAIVVPVLTACSSSSQTRRPVSNLNVDDSVGRSSQTALSGNSGVQIYGTVNAGYGHTSTKTKVRGSDGSTRTIRSSRTGMHSW
ncbi:MAG: hypothetical protein GX342_04770 [Alcaligenaceae bacterium]|jgi:uncharacterized lipoprotein|nr:hypothetical protein [Alcaligenaceae bacterium]